MDDRMAQVNAAIAGDDDLAPRKAQGRQERQGRGASKSSMAGAAYTQAHHIPADIYRAIVIRYGDLAPRKAQGRQERQGRGASKSSMAGAAYTQAHHIPADIYRAIVIRYGLIDERKNDVMLAALVIMSGVDLKDAGVNDNVVRIVKLMRKRDDSQMEQMKDVMKRLAKARLVIMSGVDLKDAGVNDNVVRIVKLMRKRDDSQMEQMKDVMKRLAKARAEDRRLLDQLEGMLNWLIGDRLGILNRSGMDADTFDMNESGAQDLLASARRSFEGFHSADRIHNERIGAGMVANRRQA